MKIKNREISELFLKLLCDIMENKLDKAQIEITVLPNNDLKIQFNLSDTEIDLRYSTILPKETLTKLYL